MAKKRILPALCLVFCGLTAQAGGPLRIESRHQQLILQSPAGPESYHLLESDAALVFSASGPAEVSLRFCQLMEAGKPLLPLDVTVVRDEKVQGTVRARLEASPSQEFSGGERCSASQLLVISVPAGKHSYLLIFTGAASVAVTPAKTARGGERTLEATPHPDRQVAESGRKPAAISKKPAYPLENPAEEVLESPPASQARWRIESEIMRPLTPSDTASRVTAAFSGMLLTASAACLVSAGTLQYMARREEVQVEAGRLHTQARRAWKAAAVTGALAALASLSALSFYLQISPEGLESRVQLRF